MSTTFTELNAQEQGSDGVYKSPQEQVFNYSDGQASEQQLHDILTGASDLSSDSSELQQQITDWPSEYHLSSTRANLLRGLDLSGVTRVLELGCGCGSISRYLGEQAHLQIDSVEGSPSRAALAALRCRDLDNVNITCGNFNQLNFPDNYYDLVLYVGVTEYAGRFSERDDHQALQDLLALAKRTTTDAGVVLIAIENRTGLKYMMGAGEDHYGVPYVGIDDYPQSTGIRTYTKTQWQTQIGRAAFSASQFIYPFPDYKIPSLLINDGFLESISHSIKTGNTDQTSDQTIDKHALFKALAKVKSRDYLSPFDLGSNEPRMWQSVVEAGVLAELSNSFMILLSEQGQSLEGLFEADFVEYPVINHDVSTVIAPATSAQPEQHVHLQQQLQAVSQDNADLRQKVNLMSNSRGWRMLNVFRSVLEKLSIIKK